MSTAPATPAVVDTPAGTPRSGKEYYWLCVLCVLGLDYFSTLAYQPSITFHETTRLGPLATAAVVLVTLFGAVPVYCYLAGRSPGGQGSLGILERLVRGWRGKTLVLVLLGFAATDFTMLKSLSLADAAVHVVNRQDGVRAAGVRQFVAWLKLCADEYCTEDVAPFITEQLVFTIFLGVVATFFWLLLRKGFTRNVMFLAVPLVGLYLLMTAILIGAGLWFLYENQSLVTVWFDQVMRGDFKVHGARRNNDGWDAIVLASFLALPYLALGLSGFEMSMILMPQVKGKSGEHPPKTRIRATRKVLILSALIMSIFLLGSVFVTTLLIPSEEFDRKDDLDAAGEVIAREGQANDRALSYLAHGGRIETPKDDEGNAVERPLLPICGVVFGTIYDVVTVLILCLAGTSVMTALAALFPLFLRRFGMEFKWAERWGVLLFAFAAINILVTVWFHADVEDQRGAYATGVLVMIACAAVVTVIDKRNAYVQSDRRGWAILHWINLLFHTGIAAVFVVTMLAVALRSPSGMGISLFFIAAILGMSIVSRAWRTDELRTIGAGKNLVHAFKNEQSEALWDRLRLTDFPALVPVRPGREVHVQKEKEIRAAHQLDELAEVVFLEVCLDDPSDFFQQLMIEVVHEDNRYTIRVSRGVSAAHAIAAIALQMSRESKPPVLHFGWPEMSILSASWSYLAFGEGNIPWKVRELMVPRGTGPGEAASRDCGLTILRASRRACPGGTDGGDKPRRSPMRRVALVIIRLHPKMQSIPMSNSTPAATSPGHAHPKSFWLWVMCLTGVDYFSTLGYQPSIAFEATGLLTPFATAILVLVTLLGALPVYAHVAAKSPHGQGSIAMLEHLLHGWAGKLLVLVLLGFAATDFVITKTMSAADAAAHVIKNPFCHAYLDGEHWQMGITMFLLVLLGAMFMRGFKEVIGLAIGIVGFYLLLNLIVVGSCLFFLWQNPLYVERWLEQVGAGDWHFEHDFGNQATFGHIALVCALLFPKLALGLSGFETGVAVMPLVQGKPTDTEENPSGRIRNTRKLLVTAAAIMSVFLLGSALTTSTLIAPEALAKHGAAHDRALAYLAHGEKLVDTHPVGPVVRSGSGASFDVATFKPASVVNPMFGKVFGSIYDLSTVVILWFAGASAMAGLLNLVPQYLPRYGMAPEWSRAFRPLVFLFTAVGLFVTWRFKASVTAQGAAYATGVLVLMSSACIATLVDRWRSHTGYWFLRVSWPFALITAVFLYTTVANMIEKPDGLLIASWFIIAIVVSSIVSRFLRSKELRFQGLAFVDAQSRFLWDSMKMLEFPVLVPHRPGGRSLREKEESIRREHRLGPDVPVVFIEANLGDTSDFYQTPMMEVIQEEGVFILRINKCASVAHTIAALALELSKAGSPPEIHFGWSDERPMAANLGFLLFGEGNVPWMVRELIRDAEPDSAKRPRVIVG